MMNFNTDNVHCGYNEEIHLLEYEKLKDALNKKYNTSFTAFQVRADFEEAYNKLFDMMMAEYSEKIFDILYVFVDCFNISEAKAFRHLNKKNREIVRSFAINNYNTLYYQNIEKRKQKDKLEKKGKNYNEFSDIGDLFTK